MSTATYPVQVDAELDTGLSRWLWLVKWLLAIPHYIVLFFLWLAFLVLSVVAFFAILFTGRYPRSIFDFNVGVLRWSWRVTYYSSGALATDRYPPFSLQEHPEYPARLAVDYPERLSRGLVLVKWWLLAIPHYIVVGLLVGGAGWSVGESDRDPSGGLGLIGALVLVAAVVLLFTGRYPSGIYDLVLGLNRWTLRVAGYAALMTDAYPPFRLDQGGPDRRVLATEDAQVPPEPPPGAGPPGAAPPGAAPPGAGGAWPGTPPPPGGPAPAPPTGAGRWTAGRVTSLVIGCFVLVAALVLCAAGAVLGFANAGLRDDDGYLMSDEVGLTTDSYALTSETVEVDIPAGAQNVPEALLGDARIRATSTGESPVFIGVAATADVDRYLAGVGHATVANLTEDPRYRNTAGGAPSSAPGDLDIWTVQSSGPGEQSVSWPFESGNWTIVVMNADGSAGVSADVSAGATVPGLGWLAGILLAFGLTALVLGLLLVILPIRAASREP